MPSATAPAAIDLRSDTVTHPTAQMYERMATAPLGDDGLEGDPTVAELESVTAGILGKAAALYAPTATMANLLAVLAQAGRQEQVLAEAQSHLYNVERGAAAITGTFYQGIAGERGAMALPLLAEALAPATYAHRLRSALVCMETSHNHSGGSVLPLAHMQSVHALAQAAGARVHLDGARLFNAAVALEVAPAAVAAHCDTVSICLCKGLSAPMGGVLAGPAATIAQARRLRAQLGGTQRQVGIAAAAGLVAVTTMVPRLAEDHVRARALARGIARITGLAANQPQTNMVLVDVAATGQTATHWQERLERLGVSTLVWAPYLLRCVVHRHITDADIAAALAAMASLSAMTATAVADEGAALVNKP